MEFTLPAEYVSKALTLAEAGEAIGLYNLSSLKYLGHETENLEDARVYWQTPGFDLATDTWAIWAETGEMVGFAEFWDIVEPHTRLQSDLVVHPDYEGRGIETYLLAWIQSRAEKGLQLAPTGVKVTLGQGVDSHMPRMINFLESQGYRQVRRYYHMHIELDREPSLPQVPQGYHLRPYEGEAERVELLRSLWESFHDHWGVVDEPFENFYRRMVHFAQKSDPTMWYIAFMDGEVAGGCLCDSKRPEDPNMGWISTLGVRRKFRKQGLGLALLQLSFGEFYRRGKQRAGLGVDASSLTGAVHLYESAGMHAARILYSYQKVLREGIDLTTQSLRE